MGPLRGRPALTPLSWRARYRASVGETTLLSLAEGAELLQDKTLSGAVDLPLYTYANAREFVPRTLDIRRDACARSCNGSRPNGPMPPSSP